MLIMREILLGHVRFEPLVVRLDIARNVLSARLGSMVAAGLLTRTPYRDRPERYDYLPTAMGADLFGVLVALKGWGDRWVVAPPSPARVHEGCGRSAGPVVVCGGCSSVFDASETTYLGGS